MKRTKLKKKSKMPISRIQRKIWELCKQIIRKKYGNTCFTCGATGLVGSNWHTSHFIPKAACGAYLKYDLRNLRPACYNCNINLGGNGAAFYKRLVETEGQDYVDQLFRDKNITVRAYEFYLNLLAIYQNIVPTLSTPLLVQIVT